jgi:hypothetical protein
LSGNTNGVIVHKTAQNYGRTLAWLPCLPEKVHHIARIVYAWEFKVNPWDMENKSFFFPFCSEGKNRWSRHQLDQLTKGNQA